MAEPTTAEALVDAASKSGEILTGYFVWAFLGALALMASKEFISSMVHGMMFRKSHSFDQVYYISGRVARFVRQDSFCAYFYMEADRFTVMPVPNTQLHTLICEHPLPVHNPIDAQYIDRAPAVPPGGASPDLMGQLMAAAEKKVREKIEKTLE